MASGDTLAVFIPQHNEPPSSNYAETNTVAAAEGLRPVLEFDAGTDETAIFSGVMPRNYAGTTGVTVTIWYAMASSQSSDEVVWDAAFEKVVDGGAMGGSGSDFAAVNSVTDTADNTADNIDPATITFTDGADMDSVVAGDPFRFKLTRDANNGDDTATGDAELYYIEIKET